MPDSLTIQQYAIVFVLEFMSYGSINEKKSADINLLSRTSQIRGICIYLRYRIRNKNLDNLC
jgi:hypothetical protein